MLKLLVVSLFLVSAPAFAAKAKAHLPPQKKAAPAPAATEEWFAPSSELDREILKNRGNMEDLREELKLSANGKEATMENIPLAPEETSAE